MKKKLQEGNDTFWTNKYAVPTIKHYIIDVDYRKKYGGHFKNAQVTGWLFFDNVEKKIVVKLIQTNLNKKDNQLLMEFFENTYKHWDLSHFTTFKTIAVSFSFYMETLYKPNSNKKKASAQNGFISEQIKIEFLTPPNRAFPKSITYSLYKVQEAQKHFNKGLKEVENNNLEKALDQFKKSNELNPKNADALYNMGSIYFKLGDANAACACYLKLKNMGQREAAEIYDQYCKEHKAAENVRADNDNPDQ